MSPTDTAATRINNGWKNTGCLSAPQCLISSGILSIYKSPVNPAPAAFDAPEKAA